MPRRPVANLTDPSQSTLPQDGTCDERVPLPGTGWSAWGSAILRSAGFPVTGLELLSARSLADAADAFGRGELSRAEYDAAFDSAAADLGQAVVQIAQDPRFRAALTWQNPGALEAATAIVRDGPDARRTERRRRREEVVAKYWQRYCGKNDSVGFFGPFSWARCDDSPEAVRASPGPDLVRWQEVFFERWALVALARAVERDPATRRWLPVALQPHLTLDGATLLDPKAEPREMSSAAVALLRHCDGAGRAHDIAERAVAAGAFRRIDDALAQLEELRSSEVVTWGIDLPYDLGAEEELVRRLGAIDDGAARQRAFGMLGELRSAREEVAAADHDGLPAAIASLEERFEAVTGQPPRHSPGETYAGRTVVHVDAVRDVEVTIGAPVLARLAALEPLMRSSRWLTSRLAEEFTGLADSVYDEVVALQGSDEIPFAELWFPMLEDVVATSTHSGGVVAEFVRRWDRILDIGEPDPSVVRVDRTATELNAAVDREMPADGPGWAGARIHSPDVHVCAAGPEALARGEFSVVLGEIHLGWAAFDTDFFRLGHDDPESLARAWRRDVPTGVVRQLNPDGWPRNCARNAEWMTHPEDVQLAFAPGAGVRHDRLLPVTSLIVRRTPAGLEVSAPDGRSWSVVEMFAGMLGISAFDSWKLAGQRAYTPRVVVDDVVVLRRTWRSTVAGTGLADAVGERERYLAVRDWAERLHLPDRVFVRLATELKPCYVDLTSPVFSRILCNLVRGARQRVDDAVEVVVTEMLPDAGDAWLTDAEGRTYCSEFRLQLVDPFTAPDPSRAQQASAASVR